MSLPEDYAPQPPRDSRPRGSRSKYIVAAGILAGTLYVTHHEPSQQSHGANYASVAYREPASATPIPEKIDRVLLSEHWLDTDPKINLWHIFHGEFNSRAEPVGFHARPKGVDPEDARLVALSKSRNRHGVYEGWVWIEADRYTQLRAKRLFKTEVWRKGGAEKRSTFFPDNLRAYQVVTTILDAFRHSCRLARAYSDGRKYLCRTDWGFSMNLWTDADGDINTAYPIYESDSYW